MQPNELRRALIQNPRLYKNVLSYGLTVPSAPTFWYTRRNELQSMIEQVGPPTLFFTLSFADHQSPELIRILDYPDNHPGYGNSFRETIRRAKLVNLNPLLATMFYELRMKYFIENVLFKKLDVIEYWMREESQHRGSLHRHGFLWLRNAPSVENLETMTDEQLQEIINYYDRIASCFNPNATMEIDQNEQTNPCRFHLSDVSSHPMYMLIDDEVSKYIADYQKLINTVQRHTTCSSSLKRVRGSKILWCVDINILKNFLRNQKLICLLNLNCN